MALADTAADSHDKQNVNLVVPKIVVFLLFFTYFGPSEVLCDEEIPFCKDLSKKLENDEDDWRERCLETAEEKSELLEWKMCNTSSFEAEKEFQKRKSMHLLNVLLQSYNNLYIVLLLIFSSCFSKIS
jgi:thiol-disulfide isomerase/thioredoxin